MDPETIVVSDPPPSTETVEAAGEAAVEIAEIEANRDIEIAKINAETTETIVEAQASEDEDVAWLKAELAYLRTQCETNAGDLLSEREARTLLQQQMTIQGEQIAALLLLTPLPNSEQNQPAPETEKGESDAADGPRESPEAPASDPAEEAPPAPADKRRRRYLQ